MEDCTKNISNESAPESPKPLAFTIDFNDGKVIDTQRHKCLVEKYQKRHRRGQSLSKIEDVTTSAKKQPSSGNLPRKSSFQSEGYFSSDEKSDRCKNVRAGAKKSDLTLALKDSAVDKMTQSFPSTILPSILSPGVELKDISSPELDLISPISPSVKVEDQPLLTSLSDSAKKLSKQYSSPRNKNEDDINVIDLEDSFIDGNEFDFDKSDAVSETGTYTLDADNYTEEQKLRMSIDRDFKIEHVSGLRKTQEYVESLRKFNSNVENLAASPLAEQINRTFEDLRLNSYEKSNNTKGPLSPRVQDPVVNKAPPKQLLFKNFGQLSPIISPTQNLSVNHENDNRDILNKTFSAVVMPTVEKPKANGTDRSPDQGTIISVTSSGAFRSNKLSKKRVRNLSLTKSEVLVETYIDQKPTDATTQVRRAQPRLQANIINVQNISVKSPDVDSDNYEYSTSTITGNLVLGRLASLPPVGNRSGKNSPTKIPSPIQANSRPRSQNGFNSPNVDLSDSSLETESYLQPTQNFINSLQQRLSLNSDDDEFSNKYGISLNNSAQNLIKHKALHTRHNSLDEKNIKISNKLEHFQNKNLQAIDQTFNLFNQYSQNKVIQKVQNSPTGSPIRRSSSFTTKNQINVTKNTNIPQKESNLKNSPLISRVSNSIQRSASTASMKQNCPPRRSSIGSDHQKIDRTQFGDTESSSEEDLDKIAPKKKDLTNLTNTRYNRAFSLRRGRLDVEPASPLCPNTPEMKRKFPPEKSERSFSVDRKPAKTGEVQSRYLLNISKKSATPTPAKPTEHNRNSVPKNFTPTPNKQLKPQVFSRTDSGRFSMRTTKPPATGAQKNTKKDANAKKSSGRSNSSLSNREVDFQNWKRRKSYDPMKAAAEGKKRELAKRQSSMTQSYTDANQMQDIDSSPSHSSSVHRSQSFHGTAALGQFLSSEDEELTLSADEGFSPPTPSPCELSPARARLRSAWREHALQ